MEAGHSPLLLGTPGEGHVLWSRGATEGTMQHGDTEKSLKMDHKIKRKEAVRDTGLPGSGGEGKVQ